MSRKNYNEAFNATTVSTIESHYQLGLAIRIAGLPQFGREKSLEFFPGQGGGGGGFSISKI